MVDAKKTTKKKPETATNQTEKPLITPNTILKLIIPAKEAEAAYNKALGKLAKKVSVAGFRKGKVPAKVAEEHLKPEAVIEEALQILIPDLYSQEIKKSEIKPLTYPEFNPVSLEKDKDWVVEAHVAQRPEINLRGYEKIVSNARKVANKELEQQLESMKKHVEESKDEKHDHSHAEPTEQEKNDFITQFIYRELVTELKPQVQELLVKEETRYDLDNLAKQLQQVNITFEKFLEQRKMTFEQLSNELAAGALARLQIAFIIDEIAKNAKLTVEKSDLETAFAKVADEKLRKQQESDPRYTQMIAQTILRQKVADHLLNVK
jgi:FKBP-type peptidyl-prolyl cis-trans isomerase (trigger factor)